MNKNDSKETGSNEALSAILKSPEFSGILDNIADAFYIVDSKWRLRYANRKAEECWNCRRKDILGTVLWDMFPASKNTVGWKMHHKALREHIHVHWEEFLPGSGIWADADAYPVSGGLAVYFRDITERKKTDEALGESERKYQELVKLAPAGIYEIDFRTNRFISVNDVMCEWMGYTREEFLNMGPAGILHKDDMAELEAKARKWISGDKPDPSMEYKAYTKDGRAVYALLHAKFMRDESGRPVGAAIIAHNITERKLAEEAMRDSEENIRGFMFATSDIIYRMSPDWGTMTELYGKGFLTDKKEPNRNWLNEYIHPDSREYVTSLADECIREKKLFELEHRVLRADGSAGWIYSRAIPLLDEKGDIKEWFGAASDITKRRQTEEEAKTAYMELEKRTCELNDERRRLFSVLETLPVMICLLTSDYHVVFANRMFRERHGESDGRHCYEYCHGYSKPCDSCEALRPLKTGQPHHWEFFDPEGDMVIDVYDFPFTDINGTTLILEMDIDITEHRRAEKALGKALLREEVLGGITSRLLESEDPQAVIEDICRETVGYIEGDVFFNYICEGGRLHLNACSGIPSEEAEKLEWLDFGEAVCGCAAKDGKRIVVTDVQNSKDPKVKPLKFFGLRSYASFPLKSGDHVAGTLAFGSKKQNAFTEDELMFMNSVSEHVAIAMNRLMITRALRESEEKYRELVKYAPAGICEADFRTHKFLSVNDAMCRILGYSKEEMLAMDPSDLLDEQGKEVFLERIGQWLKGEKPEENIDFCVLAKSGRKIYGELYVNFKRGQTGEPLRVTVVAHDITERRQNEKKINRQNTILQAIKKVYEQYVYCGTMEELGKACLEIIEGMTGSKCSFIGEVGNDGLFHEIAVSMMGLEKCGLPDMNGRKRLPGSFEIKGLYGGVLNSGKAVIANTPTSYPDVINLPKEHAALKSFLGVPFFQNGSVAGMVAVANREGGYTEDEREELEALAPTVYEVLLRKRTEEALSESESKYEMLVKYAPAGICEMDFRTRRFISVNDVICRMSGYSREELLSMDPAVLMDERGIATFLARVEMWIRGKESKRNVDYKIKTKDGREIFISLDVSFIKDEDGEPTGVTAIVHDITKRRKDEAMINRKNRILQLINRIHERSVSCGTTEELELECLETINAVIDSGVSFIGELKGERLMYEISLSFGSGSSGERLRRRLSRLNHEGLLRDVIDSRASLIINGDSPRPGGTGVPGSDVEIHSFLGVPFIRGGNAVGLIAAANREDGFMEDEKEALEALAPAIYAALQRKRAEEALKESEERLAAEVSAVSRIQKISASFVQEGDFESILYNILKAAIIISGAYKGTLQLLQPGSGRLEMAAQLGFEQSYVDFFSSMPHDNAGICTKALQQEERIIVEDIMKSPVYINTPALDIHLAAGVRAVQSTPLISRIGKVVGILSTYWDRPCYPGDQMQRYIDLLAGQAADIIERKRAEEELRKSEECALALVKKLEEADRNKNDFLSALSHEIRNPLATISAGLQLMEISRDESHIKNAREAINRQMGQLCSLVDDLLDLTRISNNRVELRKQRIELGRLVSLVAKDHMPLAAQKGLKLETDIGKDIYVDADPVRIKQIIGNLLQNAFKFTETGAVILSTYKEDGHAVICVKDPGIGISPEDLPRMFVPFMQLGNQTDGKTGGVGLGLSIVKGIAQLHGGDAGAYSEGKGKGSEFYIMLPVAGRGHAAPEKDEAATAEGNLKVLLIEDNSDYSEMMCELLRFLGHDAVSVSSGTEGIKKAKEDAPDVIICDIGLPGINGFETARRLREDKDTKNAFLVSLTGYAGQQYEKDAQKAGFDLYIKKPADINALKHILGEASRKRRP